MDCLYSTIPKWMNTEDGSGGHLYVGVWAPDCSLGVRRPGSALHATDSAQPQHSNDTAVVSEYPDLTPTSPSEKVPC